MRELNNTTTAESSAIAKEWEKIYRSIFKIGYIKKFGKEPNNLEEAYQSSIKHLEEVVKVQEAETTTNEMTVFDIKECSLYLRMHPEVLRRQCRINKIPHFKVGGKYLFRKETIDKWIGGQEVENV